MTIYLCNDCLQIEVILLEKFKKSNPASYDELLDRLNYDSIPFFRWLDKNVKILDENDNVIGKVGVSRKKEHVSFSEILNDHAGYIAFNWDRWRNQVVEFELDDVDPKDFEPSHVKIIRNRYNDFLSQITGDDNNFYIDTIEYNGKIYEGEYDLTSSEGWHDFVVCEVLQGKELLKQVTSIEE